MVEAESVELSQTQFLASGWLQESQHWHWPQSEPAGSLAKSDVVFDWVSAIVASMFGTGETIDEILEEK